MLLMTSVGNATAEDCDESEVVITGQLSQDEPMTDRNAPSIADNRQLVFRSTVSPSGIEKIFGLARTGDREWSIYEADAVKGDSTHDFRGPLGRIGFDELGEIYKSLSITTDVAEAGDAYAIFKVTFDEITLGTPLSPLTPRTLASRRGPCKRLTEVLTVKTKADRERDELNPIDFTREPWLARDIMGPNIPGGQ
jgi:hypothetical protein